MSSQPKSMQNRYPIGGLFFAGLETDERLSHGSRGRIKIGGDNGDVEASNALNTDNSEGEGVYLDEITLITSLCLASGVEIEDEVRKVVEACYQSIQAETFTQTGKE